MKLSEKRKIICMLKIFLSLLMLHTIIINCCFSRASNSHLLLDCECDAPYHDECVKIGVNSIIVVKYDEQIEDNRELWRMNCYQLR